jgi:hypothetical protein
MHGSLYGGCVRNPSSQNPPLTPESERRAARAADRMQRLQMTDPDNRRQRQRGSNSNSGASAAAPVVQQPVFLPHIPQVVIPENLDAPRLFPRPVNVPQVPVWHHGQPVPPPAVPVPPAAPVVQQPALLPHIPQVVIPVNLDAPRLFPRPVNIPQVCVALWLACTTCCTYATCCPR